MVDRILNIEAIKQLDVAVPETVYPPREDSLSSLRGNIRIELWQKYKCIRNWMRIWNSNHYDVGSWMESNCIRCQSVAISATLGNLKNLNLHKNACVIEGGLGEGLEITKEVDLLVWNIPYLDVEKGSSVA